jgi:hypothetical protein
MQVRAFSNAVRFDTKPGGKGFFYFWAEARMKILMSNTSHLFKKQNITTLKGGIDIYKCKCGIEGKRHGFTEYLELDGRFGKQKAENCPLAPPVPTIEQKRIKITSCHAFSKQFEKIEPGSVHSIVPIPEGENTKDGVWIAGKSEPVKVLYTEFTWHKDDGGNNA